MGAVSSGAPGGGPPAPRRRGLRRALQITAIAVVVLALAVVADFTAAGWKVVVQNATLEYSTPPTEFCPSTLTTGYGDGTAQTVSVAPGGTFVVTWQFGCEVAGTPPNATYAIESVPSSTEGFSVVTSNVPVPFGATDYGVLVVTLRAPALPGFYSPVITIVGGPVVTSTRG